MAKKAANRDERVDTYIQDAAPFARPILERIRAAHHRACPDIEETVKWSMPHFEKDGLVSGVGAFKKHVNLWFWLGSEMDDPTGLFSPRPNHTQASAKFEDLNGTPTQAVLVKMIRQAVRLNKARAIPASKKTAKKQAGSRKNAGAKKRARRVAPRTPKVLADALAKNKRARAVFDDFPPSAKRDYVEWITEAKREATREKRLATAIEWMSEGKRRHWRYERK